jgi:DNA-binding IclR family transcriptional regulator
VIHSRYYDSMKSTSTQRSGGKAADGSINRTLRVLSAVAEHGPITLSALSAITELTPPTLLRTLRLMQDEGFTVQNEDRKWHATMLVWRLGCAVNKTVGMSGATDRVLHELSAAIGETVVYAAFEKGWLTYAGQVEPEKPIRTHISLGGAYRALETQTGHAVLAFLPRAELDSIIDSQAQRPYGQRARQVLYQELVGVAQRGYSTGTGDRWPGVWGAAAPVFDHRSRPIGAVGVSVPVTGTREVPETADKIVHGVTAAAGRLTAEIGGPAELPPSPLLPGTSGSRRHTGRTG